ncbi:MAG: hypothetical protein IT518_22445 [Burkholderiales bacterium]|nr:hypothetical protein [Burkholderiales bacterium]
MLHQSAKRRTPARARPTPQELERRRRRDREALEAAWRALTAPGADHVAVLAGIVVQRVLS